MKSLLLLLAVVPGIWALSEAGPANPSSPPTSDTDTPPNEPPKKEGAVPGRFAVQMLERQGDLHIAIRVDTFTGQTWTLQHSPREVKGADGVSRFSFVDHWQECLEPGAVEWIRQREATTTATPK